MSPASGPSSLAGHEVEGQPRLCACGCGDPVTSARPNARYASDACRTRAWKARTGYRDRRARQPSRNGRRRSQSVRISYRKAVEAVAASLGDDDGHDVAVGLAEKILAPALTPAGRRVLRG